MPNYSAQGSSMVPWARLFVLLVIFISQISTLALRSKRELRGDLQAEIEKYLRTLTQNEYNADFQPTKDGFSPHVNPLLHQTATYGYDQPSRSDLEVQKSWNGEKGALDVLASSVQLHHPRQQEGLGFEPKDLASVKDVESEELLGDNLSPSDDNLEKTLEMAKHAVSEALARKSESLTTVNQYSDSITAKSFSDVYFIAIVAGCCAAGIFGVISAGFCFYRLQKNNKASAEVDYPAYGVTGPSKDSTSPSGDRKLAQSAQMYHYQHQKQQMIAVEKAGSTKNTSASDVDSEEENEEGDYTVYECPGLATTGEMEVKNPLFNDDSTPMSPSVLPAKAESTLCK